MSTTSSTKPQMRVAPNDTTAANVSPSKKRKRATKGIATTTHPSIDTGLAVEAAPGDYENDLEPATSLPTKRLKTGEAPVSEEDEVITQAEPEDINTVIEDADLDGYKDDVEAGASSDEDQYSEAPMTTKGKGRGKAKTSTRSKKKADPVPLLTDAEMQAYIAGLATITDWTCEGIIPDYCKIIEWVDKDRLVTKEVVKRWIEILKRPVGEKANVAANIYKHHKKWSKVFYMKKLGLKCPGMQEFKKYLAAQKGRAEGLPSLLPPTERLGRKKVNKVNTQRAVQKNGTPAGCQVTAPTTTTSTNGHRNDSQGVHQVTASTGSQVDQATAASDQNSNPAGDDEPDHQGATIFKDGNNEEIMEQPEPQTAKKPKKVKKAPKPPTLDQQLQLLFAEASTPAKNSAGFTIRRGKKKSTPPIEPAHLSEPSKDDIARYYANRNTQDVLYFTHSSGDAILGHPSRPVIDRQCALQYSEYFLEADSEKKFDVIKYGADIDESTIGRFVACISPCLRKDLPTHDIVEIGHEELRTTEIQWSMKELKDLYLLAEELQAWDVVDMVTDRWHIELHRAFPRDIENEFGVGKKFDILNFSPDLLQHLARHDPTGLEFFTDILVMRGKEGWRHMLKYGLEMWNEGIKRIVIEKLMHDHEPKVLVKEERYICEHFHRHHEYQGYVCYKVAGQEEPEGQADSEDAPEVAPEDTSPVAQYWKRQPSLRTEQNGTKALHLRTQGSKRKRLSDRPSRPRFHKGKSQGAHEDAS
jgi:hypothetical protein